MKKNCFKFVGYTFLILMVMISSQFVGCQENRDKLKEGIIDKVEEDAAGVKEDIDIMDEEDEKMDLKYDTIYLAGGCFWGMEGYFRQLPGVKNTEVGYANGKTEDTNYEKVGETDHAETLKVVYDRGQIGLRELLLHYFRVIDPTSLNKQGGDVGRQYRTGIYYSDESELDDINKVIDYEKKKYESIAVEVLPLNNYIKAEDYHQDYLEKNPNGYCHINLHMADEPLFEENFQNPNDEEIKKLLDEESYEILRNSATEKPHTSELNEEYRKGIYVDKITGQPLFSSSDKFDSGCGWPSFSKPIVTDKVDYKEDTSFGRVRTEVRSSGGDNHLGHVFNDGPKDKGGLRYCINGASLRFIPLEKMKEEGYEDYIVFVE